MKIKDHPEIKWDRWLRPLAGSNLPSDNLDNATLKDIQYSYQTAPHLMVNLEHGGKTVTVSQLVSDPKFAQQLCDDLKNNCIDKTVTEIGERNVP